MTELNIPDYQLKLRAALEKRKPLECLEKAKPSITVVTIVLNAARTIERTIKSVIAQNYPNLEYIIIDGGSTDGTLEIVDRYSNSINLILSERDSGIADAFNKGVVLSQGDWICILNADDWFDEGALNRVAPFMIENTDVITAQTRFWKNSSPSYVFYSAPEKLRKDTTIGHQSVFVRRSLHEKYGLYRTDLKFASDYDFFLRTYIAGAKYKTLDFVASNMQDEGLSDTQWKAVYKEVARVQRERLNSKIAPTIRLGYKILRTNISRTLSRMGLEPVVALYRRYFSVLRKDRAS